MKSRFVVFAFFAALLAHLPSASSAERTVALGVKMGCPTCPYIVKRSLQGVAGVVDVEVSYEEQFAVVRFDDATTDAAALMAATARVGFPSKVMAAPRVRAVEGP